MPIRFNCPDCNATIQASSKRSGTVVQCPRCATPMEVPHSASRGGGPQPPSDSPPTLGALDLQTPRGPRARGPSSRGKFWLMVYACMEIVAAAILVFGSGLSHWRGPNPRERVLADRQDQALARGLIPQAGQDAPARQPFNAVAGGNNVRAQGLPNPRGAIIGKTYISPDSGPVSILDLDISGFDNGQKAVVRSLRSRLPDPQKTSLIELRPISSLRVPASFYAKTKNAVFAILRTPNTQGALSAEHVLFFIDARGDVVGVEDGSSGPFFSSVIREYYADEPFDAIEQNSQHLTQGLLDFANQPPVQGPQGMPK